MLNDIELAILSNKLQVPMVVSDILDGEGDLTEDIKYGLHETVSDLQPDSALLAIALGALKISNIYRKASSSMDVMGMEATRIIHDYGKSWVKNANNQGPDSEEAFDTLMHASEDLEAMAELLNLNSSFLRAKDTDAAKICDVLFVQASSQALIADAFITAASQILAEGETSAIATQSVAHNKDNVIQFPLQRA